MNTSDTAAHDIEFSPSAILSAFRADLAKGRFVGREGQWAAYLNGKLAKIGSDDQTLFDVLRKQNPEADIALQPIGKLPLNKARRPRAGSVRANRK